MSGLFEFMAAHDEGNAVARRKAIALARSRASRKFANFIDAAHDDNDREQRLALVAGDLELTVKQACAEAGHDRWEPIVDAIRQHLAGVTHEARLPKMCPYHREVTDISLAAGEPQAGFNAMAQHAWSDNHCKGGFEGKCNFKPEMTTQSYWDKKNEQREERRRERDEQAQQTEVEQPLAEEQPEELALDTPVSDGAEFNETEFAESSPSTSVSDAPEVSREPVMAANHQAEALKTVDVDKTEGPVPSIDKRKWTPENVRFLDVEMDGSPHPTVRQDILQKADYQGDAFSDDGRLEQTDAVTEKQKVDQDGGVSRQTEQGGTFPSRGQAEPVTSAQHQAVGFRRSTL
jgi:hypothetical protein